MDNTFDGCCMCGAVHYTCDSEPVATVVCHCRDCQKHTGSAFATALFFLKQQVNISGELKSFDKETDAGNIMTRTFCDKCGSHITEFSTGYPEHVVVHAGTLNDPTMVNPDSQCWTPGTLHWTGDVSKLKGYEKDPEF
jgi:hypothetical protein